MKSGRTYFALKDGSIPDERIIAFTRQGSPADYIIFVNRTGDNVILDNVKEFFSFYTGIEEFYGEYSEGTLVVPPYGYSIIKAKFTG